MTRQDIESALDGGKLFINIGPGKYWQARRNGQTKLWKTRPNEFRVPIKYGFRGTGAIDHHTINLRSAFFRIANSREEAERGFDRYGDRIAC